MNKAKGGGLPPPPEVLKKMREIAAEQVGTSNIKVRKVNAVARMRRPKKAVPSK